MGSAFVLLHAPAMKESLCKGKWPAVCISFPPQMNSAFLPKTHTRSKSHSHKGALSGCLCLEHRFYLSKLRMKFVAMLILNMQNMLLLGKLGW